MIKGLEQCYLQLPASDFPGGEACGKAQPQI